MRCAAPGARVRTARRSTSPRAWDCAGASLAVRPRGDPGCATRQRPGGRPERAVILGWVGEPGLALQRTFDERAALPLEVLDAEWAASTWGSRRRSSGGSLMCSGTWWGARGGVACVMVGPLRRRFLVRVGAVARTAAGSGGGRVRRPAGYGGRWQHLSRGGCRPLSRPPGRGSTATGRRHRRPPKPTTVRRGSKGNMCAVGQRWPEGGFAHAQQGTVHRRRLGVGVASSSGWPATPVRPTGGGSCACRPHLPLPLETAEPVGYGPGWQLFSPAEHCCHAVSPPGWRASTTSGPGLGGHTTGRR